MSDGYKETWREIWEGLRNFFITTLLFLGIGACILVIYFTYRALI